MIGLAKNPATAITIGLLLPALAAAQGSGVAYPARAGGLAAPALLKPLKESWPTYAGDYSARRYSELNQINRDNIRTLALSWVSRLPADHGGPGASVPTTVGGVAAEPVVFGGPGAAGPAVVGSILEVNGILYLSAPDHAWAVDARSGQVLWHYFWKTRGGTHIGNRGMAIWNDRVYFEVPDDYLIALDARSGHELWHREIADFNQEYFSTTAPILIGDHLLIGTGNDLDAPGFLQSVDPATGALQWKWFSTPQQKGDAGADTWPDADAMRHGGGNVWLPGAYDPDLHLYYVGTGNPSPVMVGGSRKGANLYTSSVVALNVDSGKMAWFYQFSPHDTHDYDANQAAILMDGQFHGRQRKLLLQAYRGGYFFVLDRLTGEHLLTSKFSPTSNWANGLNAAGQPTRDPGKDAQIGGALVSPSDPGIVNWPPPSFDPQTGLFYVQTNSSYSEYFLTDPDPRDAIGFGGSQEMFLGSLGHSLLALDYQTGKTAWQVDYPMSYGFRGNVPGLLSTAGHLLFGSDAAGNLVARDPATGAPLWHVWLGQPVTNAPETYELDGRQYVLIAAGTTLYAFALN
jgi:alcohol dehydrogenase (cytochrome c)